MRRLLSAACVLTVLSLNGFAQTPPPEAGPDQHFTPIPGFDAASMDTTADPCDNFYQYACGNFAKLHPIPADLPEFDEFANLYEVNTAALHDILEQAAASGADKGTNEQKIGDYYQSCLNTAGIDKRGLAPIEPELKSIAELHDRAGLPQLIAYLNRMAAGVFLDFGSQQNFKNAAQEIAYIDQSGLGLPEKDYYFRSDAKSVELRTQYVAHLANMLRLLGDASAEAQAEAQKIMDLETALAKASQGNVERRDPDNIYHMTGVSAFAATAPLLDAPRFIAMMGAPAVTQLNVVSPGFFPALNAVLENTDLDTLKAYMRVHLADSFAAELPKAFDDENFDFYGRKLTGTPEQQVRWKRCVNATDGALGEALGQAYVRKYFTPDMKAATLQMVHDIEGAMGRDIQSLDWMSPQTRNQAIEKLHMVADKIGYPNKWRDYSKLTIESGDALGNAVRAREFETAYQLGKIGKPVNRDEWGMTPPTVNAYYDPSMNDINFPAGILQPAFYDKEATAATNYGHIGAVVGHELTHGFDDQGAKFDGNGNLHNWWTPQDQAQFEQKTNCLVNEYGSFTAVDELRVNGKLTLGENTADNGGVRIALAALMAREAVGSAAGAPTAEQQAEQTYSRDQQFFIGYAQNWCSNERPEYLRMAVNIDPHSPDALRVKGVLVNTPEFAHAFGCKPGQPMAPVKSCRVW
jgi:putative endopeptidase